MLVARLEVAAEHAKGHLVIALPAAAVEAFLAGAPARGTAPERASERERVEGALRAVRVTVAARLPIVRAAMRELARLREGDVLATGLPTSTELLLLVGGRPRFRAAAGRVGQRLACRVLTPLPTPTPAPSGAPTAAAEEHSE
jgi:flagellar motor switch protein FliM